MSKVAIIVLADTDTHEALGRVVNAMEAVKELKDANEVQLIFDGAGTKWVGALSAEEHPAHKLYDAVRGKVTGVCKFCAGAFGATESVKASGAPFLGEFDGHPSFAKLIGEGYQVITF